MARCYFDETGSFDFWETDIGTPEYPDSLTEVPADTALWRLSYDHDSATLTVAYSGMTDADAEAQSTADSDALTAAEVPDV
jgi:hypothetical protein